MYVLIIVLPNDGQLNSDLMIKYENYKRLKDNLFMTV